MEKLSDLSISDLIHLRDFLLSQERDANGYNQSREVKYMRRAEVITIEIVKRYGSAINIIDKIIDKIIEDENNKINQ